MFVGVNSGYAEEAVRVDSTDFKNALDAAFFEQSSEAFKELNCLRSKAPKGHTFAHCSVEGRIKALAPFLQTGFERNKMGPKERALFYSQILVESSFLTKFTETHDHSLDPCANKKNGADTDGSLKANLDTEAIPGKSMDASEMALRDLIDSTADDSKFKQIKGAKHSSNFGEFRGRGLIQLTRCDNYLSVLHYINLQYRGQNPYWQPSWHIGKKHKRNNQIGAVCEKDELNAMIDYYSKEHQGKMSLNVFNAIENPMFFGAPGMDLTDKATPSSPSTEDKLNLAISGEKFMVDVAMAYWKGRCGTDIKKFLVNPRAAKSMWCPADRSELTDNQVITQCMTGCIKGKGSLESWQKRNEWFEKAQECVK